MFINMINVQQKAAFKQLRIATAEQSQTVLIIFLITNLAASTTLKPCQSKNSLLSNVPNKPNIIILIADDLGYGDLSCYGHPTQEVNAIDRMASEGLRFTQFYSADSMCSPSRAALLTGRLPIRSGIFPINDASPIASERVFTPADSGGLPREEITIPEMLKAVGYATGMAGKWHLGINQENNTDGTHLPHNHGFDFVGINQPMSNSWQCDESGIFMPNGPNWENCFLYNGSQIIQQPTNHTNLTERLVEDFKYFTRVHKTQPFFFYFSFPQIHTDLWSWKNKFASFSSRGLLGSDLHEMSWAVGEVLDWLKHLSLDTKTLVLFLSDHGPHKELCLWGGETGGLKGGKSNSYEGGFRIPAITWWPSVITPNRLSQAVMSSMDFFPTLAKLSGAEHIIKTLKLDGMQSAKQFLGQDFIRREKRLILFYCKSKLMAIRYGRLKLHYFTQKLVTEEQTNVLCPNGVPLKDWYVAQDCSADNSFYHNPPLIYDIVSDPYERYPQDPSFPYFQKEIIEIEDLIAKHNATLTKAKPQIGDLHDNLIPCCNDPYCNCDLLNYNHKIT